MGRGGGGGGGHRSGGGSFHYSGGGRSGRSSSSSSRRTTSSSYHSTRYYGGGRSVYVRGGNSTLTMIILIIIFGMAFLNVVTTKLGNGGVPKSTVERTKLSASECQFVDDWYQDDADWIYSKSKLIKGMQSFYNDTGVQPFLWITDNIDGKARPTESDFENALNQKYDELFDDEGHLIVCFMESSPNVWATYAWAGDAARNVMDDEAINILHGYFSRYYTSDMEDEEYMATVFRRTGESIMKVDKSNKAVLFTVIGVCGVGLCVVVGLIFVFKSIKKKKELAEVNRDILNTDIDDLTDPLEDKYNI